MCRITANRPCPAYSIDIASACYNQCILLSRLHLVILGKGVCDKSCTSIFHIYRHDSKITVDVGFLSVLLPITYGIEKVRVVKMVFPRLGFAACQSKKCTKELILFTSLKYEKVRLRLMRNLTFYFLYV